MRRWLISSIAITSLMATMPSVQADEVPVLDVDQVCSGIARQASGPGEEGGPDLSFDQCVKSEQAVRNSLVQRWSSFAPVDRNECIGEATAGGESSYTDLLTCLQMARDARSFRASDPSGE